MQTVSGSELSHSTARAVRGSVFFLTDDPGIEPDPLDYYEFYDDGILVLDDDGHILDAGDYNQIVAKYRLSVSEITDFRGRFILPGFIDTHIHYPQAEIIAAYGEQLVHW